MPLSMDAMVRTRTYDIQQVNEVTTGPYISSLAASETSSSTFGRMPRVVPQACIFSIASEVAANFKTDLIIFSRGRECTAYR
jgi:hypothetical protein